MRKHFKLKEKIKQEVIDELVNSGKVIVFYDTDDLTTPLYPKIVTDCIPEEVVSDITTRVVKELEDMGIPTKEYVDTEDNALGERISTEATNRIESDNALGEEINNLGKELNNKQELLVSGVNVKTINGQTLLGSGNIDTTTTGGVTKEYVDTELAKKVTITSETNILYGTNYKGEDYHYTPSTTPNYLNVVMWSDGGVIKANAPVDDKDCVNLEYFKANSITVDRFGYSVDDSGSTSSFNQYMNVYAPNKLAWMVLRVDGYTNDCAKALQITDTGFIWGNDSFTWDEGTTQKDWTWSSGTYRLTWDEETKIINVKCNLLVSNRKMFAIGV